MKSMVFEPFQLSSLQKIESMVYTSIFKTHRINRADFWDYMKGFCANHEMKTKMVRRLPMLVVTIVPT